MGDACAPKFFQDLLKEPLSGRLTSGLQLYLSCLLPMAFNLDPSIKKSFWSKHLRSPRYTALNEDHGSQKSKDEVESSA